MFVTNEYTSNVDFPQQKQTNRFKCTLVVFPTLHMLRFSTSRLLS